MIVETFREGENRTAVFLRLSLRSHTMIFPSHFLGKSKSHGQPFSSGDEIKSTSQWTDVKSPFEGYSVVQFIRGY